MTQEASKRGSGRLQIVLIGLVFGVPLVLATWLYYGGSFRPVARTNHGELLEPIVNLGDALPDSAAVALAEEHWLLLYAEEGACGEECRHSLYVLRQARLMLGSDAPRLLRVFLHGEYPPDRVFVDEQHPGLQLVRDPELVDLLSEKRPQHVPAAGYYLVDPLDNLVMYFPPDIDPGDMVEDIQHLLDLSRIG